ncbi:hypothetical protein SISSUDRAFT_1066574 [Sistotremastrum suecicum HHB10207 ss-3]|uniref:F-box domain-containing protein n=1 Tax=Sistotremastrum suecicum HHB10207 ss-3 TaxID=1314776 RepID=A0A165Y5K1_9AGAM|nr:hypothetical protein SISSUDRAFT_1066574 [Sistotremastrum suecicum HHB10207 ss-3]
MVPFMTCPVEIKCLFVCDLSYQDILAYSLVCSQLRYIITTSVNVLQNCYDRELIPLPNRYTYKTIPHHELYLYALRAFKISQSLRDRPDDWALAPRSYSRGLLPESEIWDGDSDVLEDQEAFCFDNILLVPTSA